MNATPTVYVVDDEEPIRHAFNVLLKTRGIPVQLFSSASEFLRAYRDDWRGCVFADIRMPEHSGVQIFRSLRMQGSALHVVLMTGSESFRSLPEFIDKEVLVLEKPFSARELEMIVNQALSA
ncbi:MAG: response regulator [Pirellulales bacterium]